MASNSASFVYLLVSTNGNTYVGATIDLNRRLRQHNKEIKGGAHATGIKVAQGESWTRAAHVAGFPDWTSALQFEWRWKQLSRKLPLKMNPLERRIKALKMLLDLERPTTKAIAYSDWPSPPIVNCETEEATSYYEMV
jgi:structure-specific endonuclease subunit SLX1